MNRGRAEEGAATVLAVAMIGLVLTVTVASVGVVAVITGHRRAQAAADLAALAGATALQAGEDPCRRAGAIARSNGATLRGCRVEGWEVAVTVVADGVPLPGGPMALGARGRAGPIRD